VQQTYTVVAGDTLSAIGKKLGIPWQDIAALNNMDYPYYLSIGQVLKISALLNIPAPTPQPSPTPIPTPTPVQTNGYDSVVLSDNPVMYLTMGSPSSGTEPDRTGNGHNGTYKNGASTATMPNGDKAADFNGSNQYLTVPSSSALSIPSTKQMTWEAWIRPDTLQFPNSSGDAYVDWMGKCQNYGPTCEWEARMYSTSNPEGRPNRLSAYVFNNSAGLGSGADWQPVSNLIKAGQWLHVVGEYQTQTTPSGCSSSYPGSINIWVNGVKWSFANHAPTGCMSQYGITPRASNSPVNIGTMALDTWFSGAIGKVAIYNRLLTDAEIQEHYRTMTGLSPSGSCGNTCSF
ncbi:LysM peptidoglycan-binding domain-containing protein, partial [Candidatus Giovannonibacteria bacterium]|nr:LysM peptidoglycan-binding domain-containing protein [Candidatus Giovannonibacteria bacterium]